MALDQPFVWGANGARMTPEEIAAQQKVAAALSAQGSDSSPLPAQTRGAGIWTQGLARVAKGIAGGYEAGEASRASEANAADNKAMLERYFASQGVAPAAPVATAVPAAVAADAPKIYDNDAPSPMDAPSGQDRVNMIATALGEQRAGSPASLGAINTIRTRAVDGGYGGDTPTAVVLAPKQYSSMNDPANRAALLSRATANTPEVAKVSDAIDQAYGMGRYVNAGPNDPTEGKTHFYDPASMVPANSVPLWAQGKEYQTIGTTRFLDDPNEPAAKPVQVASADPAAIPTNATPTQGTLPAAAPSPGVATVAAAAAPAPASAPSPTPGVAKVTSAISPALLQAYTSPYADPQTKALAGMMIQKQLTEGAREHFTPHTDAAGNDYDVGTNGERKMFSKADEKTPAEKEYEYGQTHPGFPEAQLAKTKAGAAQLNNQNNIDMNSSQTYDKQLSEGLGKSHAALANGVEDAQARARDIAAMQGAVDAIQKNNGTTGGMLPAQRLELQKSINAGAAALGMDKPFSEDDISDKEFLTKFNRSMAGAQAKNAVGSRVTNFEMSNFLKANPGLDMSITGNQRLLGIQSQIEQRNIAVGNAIRDATAQSISSGKKIDPVTVQGIITDYDKAHHIQDPTTGQDLTQSYALPEFQKHGNNAALAADHNANVGKMQRTNTGVTWSVQ